MRGTNGFVLGVGTAYLLDPSLGRTRRKKLLDRTAALGRRSARLAAKKGRFTLGKARGVAATVTPTTEQRPTDDATVLQRIRSEALRAAGVSTQEVEVQVENGVATLKGTVASAKLADDLLERVRDVPGVEDVAAMIRVAGESSETTA
jgi:osmotically-inducible protein OsmY